jgi:GAF domain-containing protein
VRTLRARPWLIGAIVAELGLVLVDIAFAATFARSLYLLPVLAIAMRAKATSVGAAGVLATLLALASGVWNENAGSTLPIVTVVAGSTIAYFGARERWGGIAARSALEEERRQLRLLADSARITDGAVEIDEALRRLVDLLVPDLADAAWIDLIAPGGGTSRIAARFAGPGREELEAWLLARGGFRRGDLSPMGRALRGEGSQLVELDERMRIALSHDEEADDREMMERSGLRWTMALPLAPSGGPLGALGLGVGPSGRTFGPDELAFAELLIGRAGLALANTQLVGRLTATQRRLDGILRALAEAVTVHDAHGRIEYANEAAARLLGLPGVHAVLAAAPSELAARFDIRDPDGRLVDPESLPGARVVRGERPEPMLTRSVYRATGELRWLLTKATPLEDADGRLLAVNVIEDVTDREEAALRQRFLADAGEALSSSLDYEETLQRVAELAVGPFADWCSVELPDERGDLQQVALVHSDPGRVEEARGFRERYPSDPESPNGSHAVMRSGEPQLIPAVGDELLIAAAVDDEHLAAIRSLDIRSAMTVPMITGGRVLGVISFVFSESGRRYSERDLGFARQLAGRAATAIENARLYTERAEVARTLQASLLPEALPEVPGWRLAAAYRPGQAGAEVGGDFYDVFAVDGGHMALLGDVTGMGVNAAALTSLVRHTAKTAAEFDARPGSVLSVVNRALRQRPGIAPVTMLCATLRDRELTLAVAGHPLPLLKRAEGGCDKIGTSGLLLGAVEHYEDPVEDTIMLGPGDTLLMYTDGVTDTPGAESRFGETRLRGLVASAPHDPVMLLEAIAHALDSFAHGAGLDDRALLALQTA